MKKKKQPTMLHRKLNRKNNVFIKIVSLFSISVVLLCNSLHSQQLYFSNPKYEKNKSQNTDFIIIGEIKNNILVYTKSEGVNKIAVYSNNMILKREVIFKEFKENIEVIKFINNKDFIIMLFYEIREDKNILYSAVLNYRADVINDIKKMDEMNTSKDVDNLDLSFGNSKTLFDIVVSKNRKFFSVTKIFSLKQSTYSAFVKIFNDELVMVGSNSFSFRVSRSTNFELKTVVTNQGYFVSALYGYDNFDIVNGPITFYTTINFSSKKKDIKTYSLSASPKKFKSVYIEYNDVTDRFVFSALYSKSGRKLMGLQINEYDFKYNVFNKSYTYDVPSNIIESLKANSKKRNILEDLIIRDITLKKDRGIVIVAEFNFFETQFRSPAITPTFNNNINQNLMVNTNIPEQQYLYFSKDILFFSFDSTGSFQWMTAVPKFIETNTETNTSFGLFKMGDFMNVVYLQNTPLNKKNLLLTSYSILPNGTINKIKWGGRFGNQVKSIFPSKAKQIANKKYLLPAENTEGFLFFIGVAY